MILDGLMLCSTAILVFGIILFPSLCPYRMYSQCFCFLSLNFKSEKQFRSFLIFFVNLLFALLLIHTIRMLILTLKA